MSDATRSGIGSTAESSPRLMASGLPWALVAVCFWGTSSLVIVLVREVPTGLLLLATHTIAVASLGAFAVARGGKFLPALTGIGPGFVLTALLGTLVYQSCYVNGLRLAPAGEANLLNYLWPMFTAVLAGPLRGERLTSRIALAMVAGLGGSALLVTGASSGDFPLKYLGYALALGGALAWGLYSNLIARLPGDSLDHQRGILAIGALSFIPMAIAGGIVDVGAGALGGVVYLGVGSVGLAAVCWQRALTRGPVRAVAGAAYITPALSTMLLVAFAGQAVNWHLGAGLILVLAAAVLSARS